MKVRYQWSEDGAIETVEKEEVFLAEETRCYHCDMPIDAGNKAVKLTAADGNVHVIHSRCAEKSCF